MEEQTLEHSNTGVADEKLQKAIAKAEAKRNRLKQRRTAILKALEGSFNPFAAMYKATDEAIEANMGSDAEKPEGASLKLANRFYIFNFFEAQLPYVRECYINNFGNTRYGVLTEGVLFNTNDPTKSASMDVITKWDSKVLRTRLSECEEQSKENPEWVFWEGCRMKIPNETAIVLSPVEKQFMAISREIGEEIVLSSSPLAYRTMVSGHSSDLESENDVVTDLYKIDHDRLGENGTIDRQELDAILSSDAIRITPGSFVHSKESARLTNDPSIHGNGKFERLNFGIVNGEKYKLTLVVPYENGFRNLETSIKVFSQDEEDKDVYHIEELLTSSVL